MKRNLFKKYRFTGLLFLAGTLAINVTAQVPIPQKEKEFVDGADNQLWYTIGFVVLAVLGFAFYLWRKSKKGSDQVETSYTNRYRDYYSNESYDMEGVDAEKELEWLRKAKKSTSKTPQITYGSKSAGAKRKTLNGTNSADVY